VSLTQQQSSPDSPASKSQTPVFNRLISIRNSLSNFFCSEEVDGDPRLKMICGCLLLYFHMTFYFWRQHAVSLSTLGNEVFDYAPASLFQNFRWLVFMDNFQTEIYLYVLGMLALLGLFSLFYLRSSLLALCLLAFLFINKVFYYLCDFRWFANYHHFHLLYTLVFLVSKDKLRFFRGALGLSYFMSAIAKLSPSWLFGEYFNSVPGKLPLLPNVSWVVTSASVGLIVLELFGPLCWFTRVTWLRRLSFGAFILFHLYSGVIVGFWYTTLMLPLVVTSFLGFNEPLLAGYRFSRRHVAALGVFAVALLGSFCHFFIPGDVRLTAEGKYFGLFMFDANRSVRFTADIQKGNKYWIIQVYRPWRDLGDASGSDASARVGCEFYQDGWLTNRFAVSGPIRDGDDVIFNPQFFTTAQVRIYGDPYLYYLYAHELVRRYRPDRVSIRLDEQLDGHPEVATLLDIPDFAALNPAYNAFKHNEWILLPGTNSPPEYRWR
jgi:hypothetical protein